MDIWNSWTMFSLRQRLFRMDMSEIIEWHKKRGIKIGKDCNIYSCIATPESYLITIGNNVTIATGVKFITHDNSISKILPEFTDIFGRITIGNNCFIGAYSIILPGVEIGDNSIVAAGSVVTKSVLPDVIVGGNPATIISSPEKLKIKSSEFGINTKNLTFEEKRALLLSSNNLIKK